MATRRRKVEVYRLTISGLPEGVAYGSFLRNIRGRTRPVATMVRKAGEKSHALNEITLRNHRVRMRFLSYTKGHRPDVLDTEVFALGPNPLEPSQTNVEWTHVLGGVCRGAYLLLIERNSAGIYPSTLERYLQWAVDEFYEPPSDSSVDQDQPPVTVNLEAEPGPEFIARLEALDRVQEATVRMVRPNPGWQDLEEDLGEQAADSDARKVAVTMTARHRASLRKERGIIGWIKQAFKEEELDYASIKGYRLGRQETFNTEKLGKHAYIDFEIDDRGQLIPSEAWVSLSQMMKGML